MRPWLLLNCPSVPAPAGAENALCHYVHLRIKVYHEVTCPPEVKCPGGKLLRSKLSPGHFTSKQTVHPSLVPRLSPRANEATESWAGPGNEASPPRTLYFEGK